MVNKAYNSRDTYYSTVKESIIALIPEGPHIVFDIGCGSGKTGVELLRRRKAMLLIGVEIYASAAEEAERDYSEVFVGDVESMSLDFRRYFDYIICGDILEHLYDPWAMLAKIHTWMKPEGRLIISLPNVRFFRVVKNLLLYGKWEYEDAGVMDRTHLRFFTQRTIVTSLKQAGFSILKKRMVIPGTKKAMLNGVTLGLFKEFLGAQILIVAGKK